MSGAVDILSWTWIETTMLIIAVVWHLLWTGHLPFGTVNKSIDEEGEKGGPLTASLRRAQALKADRLRRQLEVSSEVQKLCRSETLVSKQIDYNIANVVSRDGMIGSNAGQCCFAGFVVAPTGLVNCSMPTWASQLPWDDSLLLRQSESHIHEQLMQIPCVANIACGQSSARPAWEGPMQLPSILIRSHPTSQSLVCEVLHVDRGQCMVWMRVAVDFPIANIFSSWRSPGAMHASTKFMLSNGTGIIVDENASLGCIHDAQRSQGVIVTELDANHSDELELTLHGSDSSSSSIPISAGPSCLLSSPPEMAEADCHDLDTLLCIRPDCSSDPAFIKHPDGSFMWAAPMGYMEMSLPSTPPPEAQTATSQLRETARALRNAVEREIAADKLRLAAVRQGLLHKLLLSQLLINLVSGVVCVSCGTPNLTPPDWDVSVSSLLMFWWTSSISHCFVGFLAIRSAREHFFSMLSALALASSVGQMWLACAVMNAVYPEGPPAAIIGAIAVLWDLPLRLAVGSQAWLVQVDLRYLLLVRPEIFMSIDSFGAANA